jgi:hypothetical protein
MYRLFYYFFRVIFVGIRCWPIENGRRHLTLRRRFLPPPQVSALDSAPSPPAPKFQELCAEVVSQQILRLACAVQSGWPVLAATRIARGPCHVHACLSTSSLALTISAICAGDGFSIFFGSSPSLLPLQICLPRLVNKWACVDT